MSFGERIAPTPPNNFGPLDVGVGLGWDVGKDVF